MTPYAVVLTLTLTAAAVTAMIPEVKWLADHDVTAEGGVERRVRNSQQCANLCRHTPSCQAISFRSHSGACRLHFPATGEVTEQPRPTPGAVYAALGSQDAPERCVLGQHAVPVRGATDLVCLEASQDFHCPHSLPPLANATAHVTTASMNATASYKCREGFSCLGGSCNVTCTQRLAWEGLRGSCLQTTWTDPVMQPLQMEREGAFSWNQSLPWPASPGWKVKVVGTPTRPIRATINLRDQASVRLHWDMRMNYLGINGVIVSRKTIDGWIRLDLLPDMPFKVGQRLQLTFVISPNNQSFLVYNEEELYTTVDCGGSCTPLTTVEVLNYVTLHEVRMTYPLS